MSKILITGALGHIGSKLIREIPNHLHINEIILLDNFSTQRYCSLFNLPHQGIYRFIEADILKYDFQLLPKDIVCVIHLAAITNAEGSFEIQERVEAVNYLGTERVAEACALLDVPLIYLSTTSVYGSQNEVVDENCSTDELIPQSPYATSKLKSEQLLQSLAVNKKLRYIICRFGTIFGISSGMRFHTAINKFCWQAVMGLPITVWITALHQKRPYLDLDDAINSLLFILNKEIFDCNIYNILTLNSTVDEILMHIKTIIPNIMVEFVDSKIMNQLSYNVSNEKFKKLGFKYNGSLAKSITDTIRLFSGIKQN
jgi:nucleoside-diphosphate-sugar epimerase